MKDAPARTVRPVALADHLWDTLDEMARQMGTDRDALVSQAVFTFARLNGFLDVARPEPAPAPERPRKARDERPLLPPESPTPVPDVAQQVRETAAELERMAREPQEEAAEEPPRLERARVDLEAPGVYVLDEAGDVEKVSGDRFVIGRGTHCDLVIRSGKVSREHAVIVREGADYFIEDLDSSNGTYFNKQRIKRRKLHDGDEFLICNERLRIVIR